jgi:hypothetical protein
MSRARPAPTTSKPRSCRRRSASRTGVRLTPSECAASSSGIRSPGANRPSQIASRRLAKTNSLREVLRSASDVAAESLRVFSATTLLVGCDAIGVGFAFSLGPSSSLQ